MGFKNNNNIDFQTEKYSNAQNTNINWGNLVNCKYAIYILKVIIIILK
jgi:hypothetical protein